MMDRTEAPDFLKLSEKEFGALLDKMQRDAERQRAATRRHWMRKSRCRGSGYGV
jgi:hypothetical protein